jgi:hypothetical protein
MFYELPQIFSNGIGAIGKRPPLTDAFLEVLPIVLHMYNVYCSAE